MPTWRACCKDRIEQSLQRKVPRTQHMYIRLLLFFIFLEVNSVRGKEGKRRWEEKGFVSSCFRILPKFIDKTEERN